MTILLASLQSGGTEIAESGHNWTPYWAGGISLVILLVLLGALLAFGKGRGHS